MEFQDLNRALVSSASAVFLLTVRERYDAKLGEVCAHTPPCPFPRNRPQHADLPLTRD